MTIWPLHRQPHSNFRKCNSLKRVIEKMMVTGPVRQKDSRHKEQWKVEKTGGQTQDRGTLTLASDIPRQEVNLLHQASPLWAGEPIAPGPIHCGQVNLFHQEVNIFHQAQSTTGR